MGFKRRPRSVEFVSLTAKCSRGHLVKTENLDMHLEPTYAWEHDVVVTLRCPRCETYFNLTL